jgi:hypothetical protein
MPDVRKSLPGSVTPASYVAAIHNGEEGIYTMGVCRSPGRMLHQGPMLPNAA